MELANAFERWEWWEQYISPFVHIILPFVVHSARLARGPSGVLGSPSRSD